MTIFNDIARRLSPEARTSVLRFREAAKRHEPLRAEFNELPHGFLAGVGFDDDLRALYVLTPLGMRVAMAAEKMVTESAA